MPAVTLLADHAGIEIDMLFGPYLGYFLTTVFFRDLKTLDLARGSSFIPPRLREGILKLVSQSDHNGILWEYLPNTASFLGAAILSLTTFIIATNGPVVEPLLDTMRTDYILPNLWQLTV